MSAGTIMLIAGAGIVPAFLWLWFWLREDRLHPEPKRLIALSFFLGMLAVPLAYVGQKAIFEYMTMGYGLIFAWAAIEEILKFGAAYIGTHMAWKYYDEPIDALIYLITAALGFATLENILFLHNDLFNGGVLEGLRTSNLRFLGASLLHVVSSAAIGVPLAFAFYRKVGTRAIAALSGLLIGTGIHTLFNIFLLDQRFKDKAFFVFAAVWTVAVILLVIFEKVKRLKVSGGSPQY